MFATMLAYEELKELANFLLELIGTDPEGEGVR
jgi:hypothetical protein